MVEATAVFTKLRPRTRVTFARPSLHYLSVISNSQHRGHACKAKVNTNDTAKASAMVTFTRPRTRPRQGPRLQGHGHVYKATAVFTRLRLRLGPISGPRPWLRSRTRPCLQGHHLHFKWKTDFTKKKLHFFYLCHYFTVLGGIFSHYTGSNRYSNVRNI